MTDIIKRVSRCAKCERLVTETAAGRLIQHPPGKVEKCTGTLPKKGGKGKYRFTVDIGREPRTGKRKQVTITRDTQKEAKAELARIRHQVDQGSYVAANKMTVAQWLDTWLESKAKELEETTIVGYRNSLCHVYDYLGQIRIQALNEEHVEEMMYWLLNEARRRGGAKGTGLRVSTVTGILGRFRESLGRAVVRQIVTRNVAEYVKIPQKTRREDAKKNAKVMPWTVAEVKVFVVGIRDDRYLAPLLLGLMGLRPAEVCGLRWSDIDLKAGTLSIINTRTMIGNKGVREKDTKSEAGERVLPMPEAVRKALLSYQMMQEVERVTGEANGFYDTTHDYVFRDWNGLPGDPRALREVAYDRMNSLGLRKVRLYDARHSCLTFLANNGVPDHLLSRWAGHTKSDFTKRHYVHPTADDLQSASDVLETLLGQADS